MLGMTSMGTSSVCSVEMLAKGLPVLDGEGLLLALDHLAHLALEAVEHHIVTNLEHKGVLRGHLVIDGAVW